MNLHPEAETIVAMKSPERFSGLPEYVFPRLRTLLDGHPPGGDVIQMSVGEPQHGFPDWVGETIAAHCEEFGPYPPNDGSPELLEAIANWISRRFGVELSADHQIMALNGTREGLFGACLAVCPQRSDSGRRTAVLMPNPFYQVYAAAALASDAEPIYVNATAETGFLPDYAGLAPELLDRVGVAYLCSPSNPQGAVASHTYLTEVIALAERHGFLLFADECYSELYSGDPPAGALQVAAEMGVSPERVVAFNSLSKRSNLAGLRSGFVAGGPETIARIRQLRAYAGAPLPLPLQRAARKVWEDEIHVDVNRALYREKYQLADRLFGSTPGYTPCRAGFFLWLHVDDGEATALKLWRETGVKVLPGAYLGREVNGFNPGAEYIRVAMVAPMEKLGCGLSRLHDCIYN